MTTLAAAHVIEKHSRKPVLGLRFRDVATGEVVRDLDVRLTIAGLAGSTTGVVTPSGVFAWRSVPGLVAWALGSHDGDEPRLRGRVTVDDPQGRYLAFHLGVTLPVDGLLQVVCGSPPEAGGSPVEGAGRDGASVPLFSLPGRPPPVGLGVVRAALDRDVDDPAAYATLKLVSDTGDTAMGVADERGQVAVFLPHPRRPRTRGSVPEASVPFGSGPPVSRPPLTGTTWELTLLAGLPPVPEGGWTSPPDLCDLLEQTPARLSMTESGATLTRARLTYGQELVLRNDDPRRALLVGP